MELAPTSFKEKKKSLIARIAWLVVFIFVANYAAMTFFWYSVIWWFDMPMHFLGGFWLGLSALWLYCFARSAPRPDMNTARLILVALGIVLAFGIGWELFELSIDRLITFAVHDNLDTMSDIFFDLAGGASAVVFLARRGYIGRER